MGIFPNLEGFLLVIGNPRSGSTMLGAVLDAHPAMVVAGDKIWSPATLLLHGDHGLIPSLEDRVGVPVRIIHAIRNPFDTIATMHRRSGASLADRTRWYFMHCEAAAAIAARLPHDGFIESHHDDLLATPAAEIERLCTFLGLPLDHEHVAAAMRVLFPRPRRTGAAVPWSDTDTAAVRSGIARFPSLTRYAATASSAR